MVGAHLVPSMKIGRIWPHEISIVNFRGRAVVLLLGRQEMFGVKWDLRWTHLFWKARSSYITKICAETCQHVEGLRQPQVGVQFFLRKHPSCLHFKIKVCIKRIRRTSVLNRGKRVNGINENNGCFVFFACFLCLFVCLCAFLIIRFIS